MTHRQRMAAFAGALLALLLGALDQTVVATALPRIAADLHGFSDLSWIVTAYLLTSTVTVPLYGKLSDLYGRRSLFVVAIAIFVVGSALCGLAQSMTQLTLFRAVQGVGAGGIFPLTLIAIGDLFSPRERGRYQAYIGSVWAVAGILGPLVGGALTDHVSWRWIFLVNIPLGLVALAAVTTQLHVPFVRRPHRIDWAGAALLTAAATALLLVSVWGGTTFAWSSPEVVGLACAAAVLVPVFLWVERRAPEPVLPLGLFRIRTFAVGDAAVLLLSAALFVVIIYVPVFAQVVLGVSATTSGLLLLPLNFGWVGASIASGRAIARHGHYRVFPLVGTGIVVAGLLGFARVGAGSSPWTLAAAGAVTGVGLGLTMQVYVVALQNAVPREDLGAATAAHQFFRSIGGALGVAVYGTVLVTGFAAGLARAGSAAARHVDPGRLLRTPSGAAKLPPEVADVVRAALASSLHRVFVAALPLALVAWALAFALEELPLRTTAYTDAPTELDATDAAVRVEP